MHGQEGFGLLVVRIDLLREVERPHPVEFQPSECVQRVGQIAGHTGGVINQEHVEGARILGGGAEEGLDAGSRKARTSRPRGLPLSPQGGRGSRA